MNERPIILLIQCKLLILRKVWGSFWHRCKRIFDWRPFWELRPRMNPKWIYKSDRTSDLTAAKYRASSQVKMRQNSLNKHSIILICIFQGISYIWLSALPLLHPLHSELDCKIGFFGNSPHFAFARATVSSHPAALIPFNNISHLIADALVS